MSTVTPITSSASSYLSGTAANGTTTTTPAPAATKALGQADFLKLLSTQFQNQDPMKPMDDTAFIAQMAQFTSLSQTTEMNKGITDLNTKLGQIADKLDAVLTAQQAAKAATPAATTATTSATSTPTA